MSRTQRRHGRRASCRLRRMIRLRKGESRHHLRCKSNGGEDLYENISVVKQVDHDHWHALFSNLLPTTICEIINHKWLDKRWKFVCVENNQPQNTV